MSRDSEIAVGDKDVAAEPTISITQDGGVKAWLTLLGGWLTLFTTFGYVNAFGVYQDYYTRTTSISASHVSWIGSVQLFLLTAMALPAGKLLDLGYFKPTMFIGSLIYIFSLFMLSLAHPDKYYQTFLSQGVGMGIGAGFLYVPAVAVQAHHWKSRRAFAMGLVVTGSSVGGIVYPIMLNNLIHGKNGFAWSVRASGFLTLALLAIANCIMTAKPPQIMVDTGAQKPNLRSILIDAPYMLCSLGVFIVSWGIFFPYFYLQLFSILHLVSPTLSFYTLSIMNGASVLGKTIPNLAADKIGGINALIPASFLSGCLLLALLGIQTAAGVVVFAVLYGFSSGAFLSLLAPAIASLSRDASEIGIRMGMTFFLSSFTTLTGNPIDGALLNSNFPWSRPIIFSAVTSLVGTAIIMMGRFLLAKRIGKQLI